MNADETIPAEVYAHDRVHPALVKDCPGCLAVARRIVADMEAAQGIRAATPDATDGSKTRRHESEWSAVRRR